MLSVLLVWSAPAGAADWNLVEELGPLMWPLCGRITEDPPDGWSEEDGCPSDRAGDEEATDYPMASNFGPRLRSRSGGRYDFHRGIDMPTDCGTPIFAVADGEVVRAGDDDSFDDQVVQLEHSRASDCEGGCYYSTYQHLAGVVVAEGDTVSQGDFLGYTGYNDIGVDDSQTWEENCDQPHTDQEHLHFGIREAPEWDVDSSWTRFNVNPLAYLTYRDEDDTLQTTIDDVDTSVAGSPVVTVTVEQDNGVELDLERVQVWIYEAVDGVATEWEQPGNEPNDDGYLFEPAFFDNTLWSWSYTHTDSSAMSWEDYDDCPYADEHEEDYSSSVHMDRQADDDEAVGSFNGVDVAPADFSTSADSFSITYTFWALIGPEDPGSLCVRAAAFDATGQEHRAATSGCEGVADLVDTASGDSADTALGSDTGPGARDRPACGCASTASMTPMWLLLWLPVHWRRRR